MGLGGDRRCLARLGGAGWGQVDLAGLNGAQQGLERLSRP